KTVSTTIRKRANITVDERELRAHVNSRYIPKLRITYGIFRTFEKMEVARQVEPPFVCVPENFLRHIPIKLTHRVPSGYHVCLGLIAVGVQLAPLGSKSRGTKFWAWFPPLFERKHTSIFTTFQA
ncbi:MAG: hypothetical protein LBQ10_04530, partial [Desulfovibrio sp.]|nr:hypothetical protein [Desulfovibrio sp.]